MRHALLVDFIFKLIFLNELIFELSFVT